MSAKPSSFTVWNVWKSESQLIQGLNLKLHTGASYVGNTKQSEKIVNLWCAIFGTRTITFQAKWTQQ